MQKDIPCLTGPGTLYSGTLMPSFPWPNALGRRECEALVEWTCEGGEDASELLFCGGPFAQEDRDGGCVGVLPDVMEQLFIL